MTPNAAALLDTAIRALGVPIVGVVIGDTTDRGTWRIVFDPSATPAQMTQATGLVASVVVDAPAQLDADAVAELDRKDLKAAILAIWEAIPTPLLTKAQLRARAIAIRKTL